MVDDWMEIEDLFGHNSTNIGIGPSLLPKSKMACRLRSIFDRRLRNRLLNHREIAARRLEFRSLPLRLQIEPTNRCNLSCGICARSGWDAAANRQGEMSLVTFNRIEPYLKYVEEVYLFGFGEAILAKNFFSILDSVKKQGCIVRLITNGTLLDEDMCRRLVASGIDYIDISLDSIEPAKLNKIRGCSQDKIFSAASNIMAARDSAGKNRPLIGISMVLLDSNLDEMPKMVSFAKKIGAKRLEVNHLLSYSKAQLKHSVIENPALQRHAKDVFERSSRLAESEGIELLLPALHKSSSPFCLLPFVQLFIHWNGDVRPCCRAAIYSNDHRRMGLSPIIGNVCREPLSALWNKPLLKALRLNIWQSLLRSCYDKNATGTDEPFGKDNDKEDEIKGETDKSCSQDMDFCISCLNGDNRLFARTKDR